jgi:transposase
VVLTDSGWVGLVSLIRSSWVSSVVGFRARIVVALGDGRGTTEVARELGTSPSTVRWWRGRYLQEGVDGLYDRARPGRPPVVDELMVVAKTLTSPPVESGLTHWSSRELAKRINVSHHESASIWRSWGIQPHRTESFTFSTDPDLEASPLEKRLPLSGKPPRSRVSAR